MTTVRPALLGRATHCCPRAPPLTTVSRSLVTKLRIHARGAALARLLGTASVLTIAGTFDAVAQGEPVQTEDVPETVLITGSLIRGAVAVGAPVTNLRPADFTRVGALNTSDLFRAAFPAANVQPAGVATNTSGNIERSVKVNLRGLDTGNATRSLLMVDGLRFPAQSSNNCVVDPSIIPALSLDHMNT